jgi:hypothetical protein
MNTLGNHTSAIQPNHGLENVFQEVAYDEHLRRCQKSTNEKTANDDDIAHTGKEKADGNI